MNIEIIEPKVTVEVIEDVVTLQVQDNESQVIEIVAVGPQGPAGAAANSFVFTQNTPSNLWVVNHNLGYFPTVDVFSSGGLELLASVIHLSNNTTQIQFSIPISGTARFS